MWWNTGLNPPRGETKVQNVQLVYNGIVQLLKAADILILGETSLGYPPMSVLLHQIRVFNQSLHVHRRFSVQFQKANEKSGIIIVHRDVYQLEDPALLCSSVSDSSQENSRVALRTVVHDKRTGGAFGLYAVHWPSLLYHGNMYHKEEAARTILEDVRVLRNYEAVCIGDFNAEPHQSPFFRIRCSRSLEFVKSWANFYNPFWKYLQNEAGSIRYDNKIELQCPYPLVDHAFVSRKLALRCVAIEAEIFRDVYTLNKSEHYPICLTLSM